MSNRLPIVVGLAWVGITVLFLATSMFTGGAAISGRVVGGHFYLGSHGNYPEVSPGMYAVSALLSAAFGLCLPLFAGVMTYRESLKPTFNRLIWIGPLLALAAGMMLCYSSVRCIVAAFSAV